jgi:pimeloyl-ACP methyl ester carboxylesterase
MDIQEARLGFGLRYRPPRRPGALACWLALPTTMAAGATPLVAIHGIRRGAREQARLFGARAAALGRPVVAPLFDAAHWPRYQRVVHRGRSDLALLGLMHELRLSGLWKTPTFELAGFSGGAQFAHRFAMLYPDRVARLNLVSAGWYTFPDAAPYPLGLAPRAGRRVDWGARFADGIGQFLQIPVRVCVGERDCVPDPNTRSARDLDAQQGPDRRTRAERWAGAFEQAARARGMQPDVAFHVLPDSGHSFRDCVRLGGLDRVVLPDPPGTPLPSPVHVPGARGGR